MTSPDLVDANAPNLFQDAPTAIFLLDAAGRCAMVNRAFTALTGLDVAAARGEGWLQIFPEAERAAARADLEKLLAKRGGFQRELGLTSAAGEPLRLLCAVMPQSSRDGAIYALQGWVVDITERRRMQEQAARLTEQLRQSEEMHRLVQRVGKFAHWTMRPGDERPKWSPEMFALWGREPAQGEPTVDELFSRADPVDRARVRAATDKLIAGEPDEVEYRVLGWDGVARWLHARREALRDETGKVVQIVGIAQDVTWRHEALRERVQRERFLHGLTLGLPEPAFVHDGEKVLFANALFATMLGWDDPDQLAGELATSLIAPGDHERKLARTRRALAGGNNPGIEMTLVRRDGSAVPAELSSLAAEYDGKPAVLEMVRDLSARRAAEEQRLVSDRASALATLASGVAHEVNNPLAWLQSNLEMIAEGLIALGATAPNADPKLRELLAMSREAREGGQRVKTIVRDLQTFSTQTHELVPQDPTDALELALRLVEHELRGRCTLVKRYQSPPLVLVDRAVLAQAFMNILTNAAQAMAGGDPKASTLTLTVGAAHDGSAQIDIDDSGPGIAPEDLPRVFEPFFTTKPVGSGTGLGLSVALNQVKSMGGSITARSTPGKGASFRVTLPRAEAGTHTPEPLVARGELARVLVVDDDPLIGQSLRRLLGRECEVVIATSAAAALEAVEQSRDLALLLIDLVMPGADGIQLYESLQVRAPELVPRIVFMTGGAVSRRERAFLDQGPKLLVEKPFQAARMRALVRDAIRAAQQ